MKYSVWYQHKKKRTFPLNLHWTEFSFLTSAVIMGVQMGEMSKLGWPDGLGVLKYKQDDE
jgi:hypothetical protein